MTTRSRPRPRPGGADTYTARLQDRAAARRRKRDRSKWLTARPLSVALTLAAEAGHIAAALIEWPAAPARGMADILVAVLLGLLATILYFGHSRVDLVVGIVSTLAIPALWFAGALVGLSLYREVQAIRSR